MNIDLLKQGHRYLYKNCGVTKTKWNGEFIKNGAFLITEIFNKVWVKLETNGEWAGAAKEVLWQFCKSLTDPLRGEKNLCMKIYDEITK